MKKKIGQFIDSKLKNLQDKLQEKKFFISHLEIRSIRHFFQRIFRGFSDDETWGLFLTTSTFLLPRLERFKEINIAHPMDLTSEEWDEQLDLMIFALRHIIYEEQANCGEGDELKEELLKYNKHIDIWYELKEKGLCLLGQRFNDLWW